MEAKIIPSGARNIRVEEVAEAKNYLAVRNERGEYYLNGHWYIQWSGDYKAAGTVIQYRRDGNKESFSAPGPLKEDLHIMVIKFFIIVVPISGQFTLPACALVPV